MNIKTTSVIVALLVSACNPRADRTTTETRVEKDTAHTVHTQLKDSSFSADRDAVVKVLSLQAKAWNEGNIDEFMTGYWQSDSLKFITKNGIRHGYDSVALNYKKTYGSREKMGTLDFSNIACAALQPGMMHVTGNWKVTESNGKVHSGIFSLIFRKVDQEWKIIIDHTW